MVLHGLAIALGHIGHFVVGHSSEIKEIFSGIKAVVPTAYRVWKDREKQPRELEHAAAALLRAMGSLERAISCGFGDVSLKPLCQRIENLAVLIEKISASKLEAESRHAAATADAFVWTIGAFHDDLVCLVRELNKEVSLVENSKEYTLLAIGDTVKIISDGRVGVIIDADRLELPYKVKFTDPAAEDWFAESNVVLQKRCSKISIDMEAMQQMLAQNLENIHASIASIDFNQMHDTIMTHLHTVTSTPRAVRLDHICLALALILLSYYFGSSVMHVSVPDLDSMIPPASSNGSPSNLESLHSKGLHAPETCFRCKQEYKLLTLDVQTQDKMRRTAYNTRNCWYNEKEAEFFTECYGSEFVSKLIPSPIPSAHKSRYFPSIEDFVAKFCYERESCVGGRRWWLKGHERALFISCEVHPIIADRCDEPLYERGC